MLWAIGPVTEMLATKIVPIPIIYVPQPLLQPAFSEDLGISHA